MNLWGDVKGNKKKARILHIYMYIYMENPVKKTFNFFHSEMQTWRENRSADWPTTLSYLRPSAANPAMATTANLRGGQGKKIGGYHNCYHFYFSFENKIQLELLLWSPMLKLDAEPDNKNKGFGKNKKRYLEIIGFRGYLSSSFVSSCPLYISFSSLSSVRLTCSFPMSRE